MNFEILNRQMCIVVSYLELFACNVVSGTHKMSCQFCFVTGEI